MKAVLNAVTGAFVYSSSDVSNVEDGDQVASIVRGKRNDMLVESDRSVMSDRWAAMTPEQQSAWAAYRQALRDVPEQQGFPANIQWPVMPA